MLYIIESSWVLDLTLFSWSLLNLDICCGHFLKQESNFILAVVNNKNQSLSPFLLCWFYILQDNIREIDRAREPQTLDKEVLARMTLRYGKNQKIDIIYLQQLLAKLMKIGQQSKEEVSGFH